MCVHVCVCVLVHVCFAFPGSTLSLVPDIGWIWEPLVGSNSDSASSALRAGRASRAGTRAGRVVRLVRLFRIVKLYKHMVNTHAQSEKLRKKQQKRSSLSSTGSTEASPHGKRSVKIEEPSQVRGCVLIDGCLGGRVLQCAHLVPTLLPSTTNALRSPAQEVSVRLLGFSFVRVYLPYAGGKGLV